MTEVSRPSAEEMLDKVRRQAGAGARGRQHLLRSAGTVDVHVVADREHVEH